ncbi:hypothetical protein DPMN_011228 [Dreissena polymorpha]|uniref:Uncharacterized protein n=1 Tax=Dreissena polymorpha TaxID=45954 RepID=A0A9D4N060_DREPO|nr:hypothetical protein DPMN_011228 [Dreissena polymorpha]
MIGQKIHVIQLNGTILKLNSHIKETNVQTKFHENWAKNVTSRVFTCFHYIHIEKNAPPTGGHLVRDINKTNVLTKFYDWAKIETNVLTKFHKNWAKNVTSRVEKCHAHWWPCLSPIWTTFELVRDINKTNVLTNFHDDWAGSNVIQLTGTIFELNSHIKETNVLTKFHENWAKNVTSSVHIEKCPTHWRPYINKTNVLTNFHDDRAKNVTSRVFTRKTAPPTGGHVFQRTGNTSELNQHIIKTNILTNFELNRDFIGKKLLTKFHEDRTINVASKVFTNKCGRMTDGRTTDKDRSQKLT